ncbi:MAG: hypothetical protein ABIG90_01225 [bacterium]
MRLKKIILIIGGFIILSLVGLGLIGYYASNQEIPEKPEIQVVSFIGEIIEIGDGFIKIQVSAAQNQGIEEDNAIITVKTTESTKYLEREIPKQIPEGKSPQDFFKQKEIAFSDLKIGDDVVAVGQGNIAWEKKFIAQSILRTKLVDVE